MLLQETISVLIIYLSLLSGYLLPRSYLQWKFSLYVLFPGTVFCYQNEFKLSECLCVLGFRQLFCVFYTDFSL